jgi:hypothetical protein
LADPFAPVHDLRIEFVDSVAGSGKTYRMVGVAIQRAREGVKTIFAMPTLELVKEFVEFARRDPPPGLDPVPVTEITSREDEEKIKYGKRRKWTTTALLNFHLKGRDHRDRPLKNYPPAGQLLFITPRKAERDFEPRLHSWASDRPADDDAALRMGNRFGLRSAAQSLWSTSAHGAASLGAGVGAPDRARRVPS